MYHQLQPIANLEILAQIRDPRLQIGSLDWFDQIDNQQLQIEYLGRFFQLDSQRLQIVYSDVSHRRYHRGLQIESLDRIVQH